MQTLNPFQMLRSRPERTSSDKLIRNRESYTFSQPRRLRKDKPLSEEEATQRLQNGDTVTISERREILDSEGTVIRQETAKPQVQSMSQLAAYARINTGQPQGESEELAARADELHFQPLEGGKIGVIASEVYDRASWEGFGGNFSKELGPKSDAWIARQAKDGFVSLMGGDVGLIGRESRFDSTSGQWTQANDRQMTKLELSGEACYDYETGAWMNKDGSPRGDSRYLSV